MKFVAVTFLLLVLASAASAQDLPSGHPQVDVQKPSAAVPNLPSGHPQVDAQKPSAAAPNLSKKGKVLSTFEVPQYTYIEVMQDQRPLWLATTSIPVKKGDIIRFEEGVVMTNFYSNALKRSFPAITFVGTVVISEEKE